MFIFANNLHKFMQTVCKRINDKDKQTKHTKTRTFGTFQIYDYIGFVDINRRVYFN